MKTLICVVLFVLFGSAVPASAQDGSGAVNALNDWKGVLAILFVGGGLLWKLYLIERNLKKDSKETHGKIEGNITALKNELNQNIENSEKRVAESVKTDVDRIYTLNSESEKRLREGFTNDVNRIYNQINTLIGNRIGSDD